MYGYMEDLHHFMDKMITDLQPGKLDLKDMYLHTYIHRHTAIHLHLALEQRLSPTVSRLKGLAVQMAESAKAGTLVEWYRMKINLLYYQANEEYGTY